MWHLFWFPRRRNLPVAGAASTPQNPNVKTRLVSTGALQKNWVASWGTPITVLFKKKDRTTGEVRLRMHVSLHPLYVRERRRAGRRYGFRPEKQRLLDAIWPVLISFCDAGKLTVGMCISRLAKELSQKDSHGKVIPETEVTVSRLSRLIDEQVRFGVPAVSEENSWDRESRTGFLNTSISPR
ncbi:Replication-associated protein (plasmid) [Klebsiella quasipneumoniae]|nr:Replication-associated protein [Klebsiella quasipneumoniae]